jgi:hypothetical protein
MIKIIIHITKFIIAAITAVLFSSCNFNINTIEGSGNVITEKRTVNQDFTNISVSNAIDLVIEQAEKPEIIVEADDNIQREITTDIEHGTLIIKCKFSSFSNATMKKVTVKLPVINEIKASSAATVSNNGILLGENIAIKSSSASNINLHLESEVITIAANSAGYVNAEGKALEINVKSSSGSTIEANKLMANEVDAKASSGSSISIHPIVKLKAKASSGASINYVSTPKTLEKYESSGGSISQG